MTISEQLKSRWTPTKKYLLLSNEEWDGYFKEQPKILQQEYKDIGFPKISIRTGKTKRVARYGIPCMFYRAIPVVRGRDYKKLVKIFHK